jgi:hypothetical protein
MNILLNATRASSPVAYGIPANFTEGSRVRANALTPISSNSGRYRTEMSAMSYRKVGSRVPYASALYAAAVAALLSACSQVEVQPAPEAAPIQMSETTSDLPEVVVTASRERPKSIG